MLRTIISRLLAVSIVLVAVTPRANAGSLAEDYSAAIQNSSNVTALGETAFGDSTDLYTGRTAFSVVDISLPGNNALEVAIRRRFEAYDDGLSSLASVAKYFNGGIDLPRLEGIFAGSNWVVSDPVDPNKRCSTTYQRSPPEVDGSRNVV